MRVAQKYVEKGLVKEMEMEGFGCSGRKMEMIAQDRAGWKRVVCGLCCLERDKTEVQSDTSD